MNTEGVIKDINCSRTLIIWWASLKRWTLVGCHHWTLSLFCPALIGWRYRGRGVCPAASRCTPTCEQGMWSRAAALRMMSIKACQLYGDIINMLYTHTHTERALGRQRSLKLMKLFVSIKEFYVLHTNFMLTTCFTNWLRCEELIRKHSEWYRVLPSAHNHKQQTHIQTQHTASQWRDGRSSSQV